MQYIQVHLKKRAPLEVLPLKLSLNNFSTYKKLYIKTFRKSASFLNTKTNNFLVSKKNSKIRENIGYKYIEFPHLRNLFFK